MKHVKAPVVIILSLIVLFLAATSSHAGRKWTAQEHCFRSLRFIAGGKFEEARVEVRMALKSKQLPEPVKTIAEETLKLIGDVLAGEMEKEKVVSCFRHYFRGLKCAADGKLGKAEEEFREVLKTTQMPESIRRMAEENLKLIESALGNRMEREAVILYLKGRKEYDRGYVAWSIGKFKKTIAINPDFIEAHFWLALAYENEYRINEMIDECRKVITINPEHIEAHYNLGMAYYRKGVIDEAIEEWEKVITVDPDYGRAHSSLASAYYERGQYCKALKHYQKAIDLGYKVPPELAKNLSAFIPFCQNR